MKSYRAELTDRDLGILEFILNMKFASSEEIFRKFFRKVLNGEEAKSDAWAKKRLMQLERAGFLKAQYAFSESKRYFIATKSAFRVLQVLRPEVELGRPSPVIDLRTFDHDKLVLQTRLDLEERFGVVSWISERALRSKAAGDFGFSPKFVPDAIYEIPSGEKVAFELEIAPKDRKRYAAKVQGYVSRIRSVRASAFAFRRVHYQVTKDSVFGLLQAQTRLYPEFFQLEKMEAKAPEAFCRDGDLWSNDQQECGNTAKSQVVTEFFGAGNRK